MNQLLELLSTYGLFLGLPLLFILIVFWIYRPGAKRRYAADGNIPFFGDKKKPKPH